MRQDSRFAFLLGYGLGRRRRRRAGIGCLLMGIGLLMSCSASFMLVSAPVTWWRARSLAALPQPTPAALATLPPGTHIILTAQLPPTMPSDANGLVLFYIESLAAATPVSGTPTAALWKRILAPPSRVDMRLSTGEPLLAQLPPTVVFLNAQEVALDNKPLGESERRAVGYVAGQVLTMQGAWEGNQLFTANELYAGGAKEYLAYWQNLPGLGLLMGSICGGVGLFLLICGALLRFVGG